MEIARLMIEIYDTEYYTTGKKINGGPVTRLSR